MPGFEQVFAALPERHALEDGVMDKGYDSNAIRAKLQEHHINPVIPPRKNRKEPLEPTLSTLSGRNLIKTADLFSKQA
jgi:hypothetical protein